jgi:uncharacterized phage-like protein YoqJ
MIIAGTGHRPDKLGGYDPHTTRKVLTFAEAALRHYQPSTVITGMAQGWDMALAQASINLNIPFHAYVPFIGQEQVWPSATRLYYKALLQHAQHVIVCSPGGYTKQAMQVRNQRMIDQCELLLALWNGSSGGTGNAIAYATFLNKPYVNLWPQFLMGEFHEAQDSQAANPAQTDAVDDSRPALSPGADWLTS